MPSLSLDSLLLLVSESLDAGEFVAWLDGMLAALRGEAESDVPCGSCTACCTSSQFIHIGPDETDALAHIPAALVFPAPNLPPGHMVMGYDERGHCPMLVDNRCTVYEHRPRTCRTYDCRVFPAAGLLPDEPTKAAIAAQAGRWRFTHGSRAATAAHDDVRAAAAVLREDHPDAPITQVAVRAVELQRRRD